MNTSNCIRVASASEIDALVGSHVMGETPEVFWEHSHGFFQFASEAEARQAVTDTYYQLFLPDVDWTTTVVREVRQFSMYCSDTWMMWSVVAKVSREHGPLKLGQDAGRWKASFGSGAEAEGRTAAVAICLAALQAFGLSLEVDHDRIDAELNRLAVARSGDRSELGFAIDDAGHDRPPSI